MTTDLTESIANDLISTTWFGTLPAPALGVSPSPGPSVSLDPATGVIYLGGKPPPPTEPIYRSSEDWNRLRPDPTSPTWTAWATAHPHLLPPAVISKWLFGSPGIDLDFITTNLHFLYLLHPRPNRSDRVHPNLPKNCNLPPRIPVTSAVGKSGQTPPRRPTKSSTRRSGKPKPKAAADDTGFFYLDEPPKVSS
jgi:hypothetical protein